jgi:energy-coupling factor transporter transmembrane protein EcfT
MTVKPARVIGWSLIGLTASILSSNILFDFTLAGSYIINLMLIVKKWKPLKAFFALSVPFFIPLLFIHAILNPQFEVTHYIWLLPIRQEGILFSLDVYSNLSVYLSLAICWWYVDRDYMVDWLAARNIPFFLLGLIMQASAMVPIVEKRGLAVLKAQTARGIATGPNLFYRIKSFPTIILPVITSLINDAEQRSIVLWSRGFGKHKFVSRKIPFGESSDIIWILCPITLTFFISVLWKYYA